MAHNLNAISIKFHNWIITQEHFVAFADNFCVFADECAVQDAVFDVCPGVDDAVANDAVFHRCPRLDADKRAEDTLIDNCRFM